MELDATVDLRRCVKRDRPAHPPAEPERLVDAISKLAQSRELRARMGTAARQRISDNFGLDAMTSQILSTYATVAPPAKCCVLSPVS